MVSRLSPRSLVVLVGVMLFVLVGTAHGFSLPGWLLPCGGTPCELTGPCYENARCDDNECYEDYKPSGTSCGAVKVGIINIRLLCHNGECMTESSYKDMIGKDNGKYYRQ